MKWNWIGLLWIVLLGCDTPEPEPSLESLDWLPAFAEEIGKSDNNWLPATPKVSSAMNWANNPDEITTIVERRLPKLPLQGMAVRIPWSDTYWPKNKGGITYRWQTGESHDYASPSRDEVFAMTAEQVARLPTRT